MKALIEIIAKELVDNPDQVKVTEAIEKDLVKIELVVADEDMGKVIGKQGKIAKAIRTVAKAAATKNNQKVTIEITQ
ncbi:MAG TPA: KH domain-containing protein [Clostridia bacterium]|jgi:hypothetical protein|nr:KH domain-containing protein [Clostridia bacterium]